MAKCGTQRIWHWAHIAKKVCDNWWETETEWHRDWKNKFPIEWQEVIQHDEQSGEKHIADVRTGHGLVIEFQHSRLNPQERLAREHFYRNMVWVVDGTRLKKDYPRFQNGWGDFKRLIKDGFFVVNFPEESFSRDWLESSVPVIFDFKGTQLNNPLDAIRDTLWCLLPGRAEGRSVVVGISREQFVSHISNNPQLLPAREIVNTVAEGIRQQRRAEESRRLNYINSQILRRQAWKRRGRRL